MRKLGSLGPLSEEEILVLNKIGTKASGVPAGTDLIREGEPPQGVFLVLEGFACRYKLRKSGARQIIAYLVPGDFCDLDVPLLTRMDHNIGTLSACQIVRIAPETIQELLSWPALARALRVAALLDAANAREWLVNLGCRTATERVAHLLCELLARLETVGLVKTDGYELPLTQAHLADTTGMTDVHMNRSLKQLKERGLIELRNKHLTVLDLPGLKRRGDFQSDYLHIGDRDAA